MRISLLEALLQKSVMTTVCATRGNQQPGPKGRPNLWQQGLLYNSGDVTDLLRGPVSGAYYHTYFQFLFGFFSGFCTPILCIILGSLWTGLVLSYPELFRWSLLTGFCTPLLYIRKVVAIDRIQYSYSLYHLGGRYWQVSALPGFSFSLLPWWSLLTGICTLILCIILVIVIDRFLLSYSVLFKRSLWTGFCTPWLCSRKVVAIARL